MWSLNSSVWSLNSRVWSFKLLGVEFHTHPGAHRGERSTWEKKVHFVELTPGLELALPGMELELPGVELTLELGGTSG